MTVLEYVIAWTRQPRQSERGASLVEYGLLLAFIAVVCLTAVGFMGRQLSDSFDNAGQSVQAAN